MNKLIVFCFLFFTLSVNGQQFPPCDLPWPIETPPGEPPEYCNDFALPGSFKNTLWVRKQSNFQYSPFQFLECYNEGEELISFAINHGFNHLIVDGVRQYLTGANPQNVANLAYFISNVKKNDLTISIGIGEEEDAMPIYDYFNDENLTADQRFDGLCQGNEPWNENDPEQPEWSEYLVDIDIQQNWCEANGLIYEIYIGDPEEQSNMNNISEVLVRPVDRLYVSYYRDSPCRPQVPYENIFHDGIQNAMGTGESRLEMMATATEPINNLCILFNANKDSGSESMFDWLEDRFQLQPPIPTDLLFALPMKRWYLCDHGYDYNEPMGAQDPEIDFEINTLTPTGFGWFGYQDMRQAINDDSPNQSCENYDCLAGNLIIGIPGESTNLSDFIEPNGPLPANPTSDDDALNVAVLGNLLIDVTNGTYTIPKGSKFFMTPGAQITVPTGIILEISDDVHIQGCNARWQGIFLKGQDSELKLEGGAVGITIEDAQEAVQLNNGSSILLNNVRFENNFIGLSGSGIGGSFDMPLIANTTFIGTEQLLPHWDGTPDADPWANIGIDVSNQNLLKLSTGGPNSRVVFDNVRTGIRMENTNGIIQHAEFLNISEVAGNDDSGIGISCSGNGNSLTVWGEGDVSSARFDRCTKGIDANNVRMLVRNVEMTNISNDGVTLKDANNQFVVVGYSKISAAGNGVFLENVNATRTYIEDNELSVIPDVLGEPQPDEKNAILITSSNSGRKETKIRDNVITIIDKSTGINFKAVSSYDVRFNEINTSQGASEYTGINLELCNFITLKTNEVTGDFAGASATSPFNSFGIKVMESANGLYSCNILDATEVGVHFDDENFGTRLESTKFNHHFHGLDYTKAGQTGGQPSLSSTRPAYRNRWLGTFTGPSGTIGAFHESIDLGVLQQNEYAVKGDQDTQPAYPGDNLLDQHKQFWFLPDPLRTEILESCQEAYPWSPNSGSEKTATDNLDGKIADGTFVSDGFQVPMQWKAERYLYEHLERDASLRPAGSVFEIFYLAQDGTTVGSFTDVEFAIDALFELSQTDETQLYSYYDQQETAMDSVIVLDSLMIGTTGSQYEQLASERETQVALVGSLAQSIDALLQTIETDRAVQVAGAIAQNNAVNVVAAYELNEKTVNDIYLQSFASGVEPDAQQVAVLEGIAVQCPYSGGEGVRQARSMLIGRSALMFDNSACYGQQQLVLPVEENTRTKVTSFDLYPNPAKDKFTLSILNGIEAQREVRVVNLDGRLVLRKVLEGSEHSATFQTEGLVSGMYFVRVMESGKEVFSGKIIVQ